MVMMLIVIVIMAIITTGRSPDQTQGNSDVTRRLARDRPATGR